MTSGLADRPTPLAEPVLAGRLAPAVVRRQAGRGGLRLIPGELWRHRELLAFQAAREIKVRYAQTLLGAGWAILQPALTMIVFTLIFGRLARIPSGNVPYPIFVFCALLPWQLFAYSLTRSSNSLVDHAQTLKKVYFPRLILPLASVVAGLVDFAVAGVFLAVLMLYYGILPGWPIVMLPVFTLLAVAAALAAGLWLSGLNVRYRDVRHTLPFLAQLWLFVTPVAYPGSIVPEQWQALYGLNPMAGVVEGFRWALLSQPPPGRTLFASVAATALLLAGGLWYFRRVERSLADIV